VNLLPDERGSKMPPEKQGARAISTRRNEPQATDNEERWRRCSRKSHRGTTKEQRLVWSPSEQDRLALRGSCRRQHRTCQKTRVHDHRGHRECGRLERLTRGAASHVMVSGDLIAAIRSQRIEPTSLRRPCSSRLPELLSFRARCEGSPLASQRQPGRRLMTAS